MKTDYFNKELKEIFVSGLAYRFKNSFILLPRHGKLHFKLPSTDFPINLFIRRVSGDGKITINNIEYVIKSQKSEVHSIINDSCDLIISRPLASVGEIEILGISLDQSNFININKNNLKKLKNYNNINLVNQELLFDKNSYLENADQIQELVITPTDAFIEDKNKILFKTNGKIIKLLVKDNNENINKNLFKSIKVTKPKPIEQEQVIQNISENSHLYFKSIYLYNKNTLKYIESSGKSYLVLKANKDFNLLQNNIFKNKKYQLKIQAKKNSGDGKIIISSPFFNEKTLNINVTNTFNDYYVDFSLNDLFKSESLQINIRHSSAIGEIMFSSLDLLEVNNAAKIKEIKSIKAKYAAPAKKSFAIIIPSFKNENWAEKNILSALNQNYDNFKVLFTDDNSPDETFNIVQKIVSSHKNKDKAILVKNDNRKGALENLYNMIHSCNDEDIILTLDGDDWLADTEVLHRLNYYYSNFDIWMTYGQYKNYPDNHVGVSQNIPTNIINNASYRKFTWCSSHLRTFYAWLFKLIKKEDLMHHGSFLSMTWDMAMMFPMLEMAGNRHKFISDILYIYNLTNPINDHKVDVKLQQSLDRMIRSKPKYQQLGSEPQAVIDGRIKKIKISLLLIATGKYDKFIQQLVTSADKFYFNDLNYDVEYTLFTDKQDLNLNSKRKINIINIEHKPFPYATLDRFKHFSQNKNHLNQYDYLHYVDVDSKFVSDVSTEALGSLVGVRHCGYFNGGGTFEDNKKSVFYLEHDKYKHYYGGGFSGGSSEEYLKMSDWCFNMIEKDLNDGIMPRWHDETALNRYFVDHEPEIKLTPSYHYPENSSAYLEKWKPYKFEPKIVLLNKDHQEVRGL